MERCVLGAVTVSRDHDCPADFLKCVPAVDPGPVLDELGHDGWPAVVAGQVQGRLALVVTGSQVPAGKGFTVSAS